MRVVRIVFCPAEFHLSTNPVQFNELTPPPRLHIVGFMKCPDGVGCFGDYLSTGRNTCRDPRKHVVGPADYQAPMKPSTIPCRVPIMICPREPLPSYPGFTEAASSKHARP